MNKQHHSIDYIEFGVKDIKASKAFFAEVFAWHFEDYGEEYCAFQDATINGGFYLLSEEAVAAQHNRAILIVFYSDDLQQSQERIKAAGGRVTKSTFSFPGGKRFHFQDTNGIEFAVWTATDD